VRKRIPLLIVLLLLVGFAAALLWPTPRRQALARVKELNGTYREEPDPDGRELAIVGFIGQPATDDDLPMLRAIRPLHRVLLDGSKVTDAGLVHLEGIEGLELVSLCDTAVTDAGMAHLRRIPTLRWVTVRKTQVSDAGLAQLHGMPQLEFVNVAECLVTAKGVEALRQATPSLKDVFHIIPTGRR
jgi:hypothetical protein